MRFKTNFEAFLYISIVAILLTMIHPAHAAGTVALQSAERWCTANYGAGSCIVTATNTPTNAECVSLAAVDPIHLTAGYVGAWAASGGCRAQNSSGFPFFGYWFHSTASCPANSTGTSTCTCNNGYSPDVSGTSCVLAVACPASGTLFADGFFNIGTVPTGRLLVEACVSSCKISLISGYSPAEKQVQNGITYYYGKAKYNHLGTNCSPDTPNFLSDFVGMLPNQTCASGQQMIQMNGVTKCFDSAGVMATTDSASAIAAAKTLAQQKAAAAAQAAADAAASTLVAANPNATASDVAAARNQAATLAAGSVAVQYVNATPQDTFCLSNPTSPICYNGVQAKTGSVLPANTNGSWYTKSYANGIEGVLSANFSAMKTTPLFSVLTNIAPTISGSAHNGCWMLPIWKQGNQQFCLSQTVLNLVGICIMLTALFAARGIIFGG